jgi:hypothetical protein
MPIQVSYGHISRADYIREGAIALLESELSDAFDTPTQEETPASSGRVCSPQVNSGTSLIEHFIEIFYAIFTAVTQ